MRCAACFPAGRTIRRKASRAGSRAQTGGNNTPKVQYEPRIHHYRPNRRPRGPRGSRSGANPVETAAFLRSVAEELQAGVLGVVWKA